MNMHIYLIQYIYIYIYVNYRKYYSHMKSLINIYKQQ